MFIGFRERGREGRESHTLMWERNINQLPPGLALTGDQTRILGISPNGIEPTTFWYMGWCSKHLNHVARATTALKYRIVQPKYLFSIGGKMFENWNLQFFPEIYRNSSKSLGTLAGVTQWLSARLQIKGSQVRFPVRTHVWVVGQVPSRGHARGNHTLDVSLSLFLLLFLSL